MASLRTRLLAGVLVLAAAGLVALAAVTYAEQRSFLLERLDQQAQGAEPALSHLLDEHGFRPPEATGGAGFEPGRGGGPGPGPQGGGNVNLPPGTWGQRRMPDGQVLGSVPIRYSETERIPAPPKLPAHVPVERFFTVSGYRVYVGHDREDAGLTVVAIPSADVNQTLDRLLLVEGLVIGGVLLALGLTALFVVRLGLRPLTRMEVTAEAIAGGELSRRVSPATAKTEVGRLGLALNRMLDRLEEAFAEREASEERLRQFLADASHELRTPLASIRGYAELFRIGATEGESTEMAMRRIEEEAKRMGVLVEDLLALARLDETRARSHEPVDLAALARDVARDARATAPQRRIAVSAPPQALVSGDPHQLHQVLANLMRNALVHTPAATPIEISVERAGEGIGVRVRDHGPGLPQGAAAKLFERFWRTEGGRERGKAGAGLGLAIAREIVIAHGGRIEGADAPGGGAVFTVRLPALSGSLEATVTGA